MLISVIIPCYNQGHFLEKAIQSLIHQTYQHWECIIVDDGSSDDTAAVAKSCLTDSRIRYIYKVNGGLSSARNAGLQHATGDYVQFLDADDHLHRDKFERSMKAGNSVDLLFTDFEMFADDGTKLEMPFKLRSENFNLSSVLFDWDVKFVFPPHSGIFKRSLFTSLQFNETLKAREDWLMWVKLFSTTTAVLFIDEVLAYYRVSPGSMSKNKDLMDRSLVQAYRLAFPELPAAAKAICFDAAMNAFDRLLAEHKNEIKKARESKSYRIGNFFVKGFNSLSGKQGS